MYIFCISLTRVFYHFGELMKNALIYIHHLVRRFIFNQEHWLSIDGLVQDCSISSANALEILQSCTEPSISGCPVKQVCNTSFILPCFWFLQRRAAGSSVESIASQPGCLQKLWTNFQRWSGCDSSECLPTKDRHQHYKNWGGTNY